MNLIKNTILSVFFISFFYISNAQTDIINEVEIYGNDRISKETIIVFGDIKKNVDYNKKEINDLINLLYTTDFFSEIEINFDKGVLKINVKEKPLVNLIVINGVKAKKFKEAIIENIQLKQKTSFTKNKIKNDISIIKSLFRNSGYYFVEVESEVQALEGNRINLSYNIKQGVKAKIAKIFFLGDKKFRDKKLRAIITSEENKFWKFVSSTKYLNKQRIELDTRLLTNFYKNKGYYEVEVSSNNVEYSEGEGFILTYNISAGQRYRVSKAFVDVSPELDKQPFYVLNDQLNKLVGKYYSSFQLSRVLEKIDKLSEEKELQFINHTINETLDGDLITIKIDIFEGDKLFVEQINIIGNHITNDTVIRSQMAVDEGDSFSPLMISKSINNIKSRNLFSKVSKKILPGSSDDLRIIEIEVEEKATGEIASSAGVGTDGGTFGFMVKENNFLGKGISLDTSLEISEQTFRGKFSVVNPNYRYSGNTLRTTVESTKTDKLKESGYETTKTGFSLGTGFEQYDDIFISPNLSVYYEDISTSSTASSLLKKQSGSYASMLLGYSVTLDKRNQRFQTTEGFRSSFLQNLPIYDDSPSLLNGYDFNYYNLLTDDMIGSFKFFSRAINSIGNDDVRISSRVQIPASKLRGFKRGRIGPRDGTDHIGGNYAAAASFGLTLPNLLPEDLNTDFNIFLDTGNVWGVDYSSSVEDSNTLRSSFGVAANVFTPIGPLMFSFAQDLSKASTDSVEFFRFNLGTTF